MFEVSASELAEHVGREKAQEEGDGCVVRLRGLPFSATAETISEFMDGRRLEGEGTSEKGNNECVAFRG